MSFPGEYAAVLRLSPDVWVILVSFFSQREILAFSLIQRSCRLTLQHACRMVYMAKYRDPETDLINFDNDEPFNWINGYLCRRLAEERRLVYPYLFTNIDPLALCSHLECTPTLAVDFTFATAMLQAATSASNTVLHQLEEVRMEIPVPWPPHAPAPATTLLEVPADSPEAVVLRCQVWQEQVDRVLLICFDNGYPKKGTLRVACRLNSGLYLYVRWIPRMSDVLHVSFARSLPKLERFGIGFRLMCLQAKAITRLLALRTQIYRCKGWRVLENTWAVRVFTAHPQIPSVPDSDLETEVKWEFESNLQSDQPVAPEVSNKPVLQVKHIAQACTPQRESLPVKAITTAPRNVPPNKTTINKEAAPVRPVKRSPTMPTNSKLKVTNPRVHRPKSSPSRVATQPAVVMVPVLIPVLPLTPSLFPFLLPPITPLHNLFPIGQIPGGLPAGYNPLTHDLFVVVDICV
eukprot:TRINITY_DN11673_c0_g1_i1.p1 TRINITY_DN11673_c0_g1~~TRINITY_DN11673_c0_g1_i1.p1  ORF type:complete len:462 (-),score=43.94 TRINITY_DN11673_c0_g1_i1:127-1512(-)